MVLARTGDISCLKYILVHSPNPEVQQDQSHGLPKVGECGADGGGVEVKTFLPEMYILWHSKTGSREHLPPSRDDLSQRASP